jgi:L-ascorbate metabolism protein UlaG (beta-lactamase superfamily)
MSGDTGGTPEMRALPNIDVAFVCMNLPFTMSIPEAVTNVRAMRPRVVYPYHYSSSDVNLFKRQVSNDLNIEVRLRKWY